MTYRIQFTSLAKKDFKNLDKSVKEQILKKIKKLQENPNLGKSLSYFLKNKKSLKVNKYRVLYFIANNDVVIIKIGHRKNVYNLKENILKSQKDNTLIEKITIVNQIDEIIGQKEKYALSKKDIFRLSCLVLRNKKNEILLAKRALSKKYYPGKWGLSVVGTNQANESYIDCILREAEEELGILIADFELRLVEKLFIKEKEKQRFTCIFLADFDESTKIRINKKEVKEVKWYTKEKLEKELKENKSEYIEHISKYLLKYYDA